MLFILCVASWLLAAFLFLCFVLFIMLLFSLLDPVWNCDHRVREEVASCLCLFWAAHGSTSCFLLASV